MHVAYFNLPLVSFFPDSKVHGANMGPTWVLSAPDEPHVGPTNFGISVHLQNLNFIIMGLEMELSQLIQVKGILRKHGG